MTNDFQWSDDHDAAFTATKDVLTTVPVLSYYNASKPTRLRMDTSQQGFGFILQQQSNGTTWNLIQPGSYFLTDRIKVCYYRIRDAGRMLGCNEVQPF